jgi:hypothetical protein
MDASCVYLGDVVLAAPSGSQGIVEKKFHSFEKFESDWCISPHQSSPAPHWFFNGVILNDGENNTQYGTIINRNGTHEGHHQSQLTIPRLTASMNDSNVTCIVDSVVILEYHLIVGEWSIQSWVLYYYFAHHVDRSIIILLLCTGMDLLVE